MKAQRSGRGLFDVRGNPIAKNQTIHLQESAQFFTSRDRAAQYRATNPDWQKFEHYMAQYNQYVAGKIDFETAAEALVHKFGKHYLNRESDDIQRLLSTIMTASGPDALDLFMEECNKNGMKIEYTPPGERDKDPNAAYMKVTDDNYEEIDARPPKPAAYSGPPQPIKGRLCDFLLSNIASMKPGKHSSPEAIHNVVSLISEGPRFVIEENARKLITDVANHGKLEGVEAPAGCCWMEASFDSGRAGFLWVGDDTDIRATIDVDHLIQYGSVKTGRLVVFTATAQNSIASFAMDCELGKSMKPGGGWQASLDEQTDEHREKSLDGGRVLFEFFSAFCGLMGAPKTHKRELVEYDKLNRQRVKSGKLPLNSYTTVKLSVDGPVTRQGAHQSGPGDPTTQKVGKRLHFVGHFWRTRLGKLEFVRPHWRGDASLGRVEGRTVR